MIGQLKGMVEQLDTDQVLIDVQGVGYTVMCSSRTLASLTLGQAAVLRIITHVREDHIHLYGFLDQGERQWFDLLLTVQGVGPKMALNILGQLDTNALAQALMLEDRRPFQAVSGVGPKLASRLVTELKERGAKLAPTPGVGSGAATGGTAPQSARQDSGDLAGSAAVLRDLISALTNLGYDEGSARSAAQQAYRDLEGEGQATDLGLNTLIPLALKALAR